MDILKYKSRIKKLSRSSVLLYKMIQIATRLYAKGGVRVIKSPMVTLDIYNLGYGNEFVTGTNCFAEKLCLEFRGNNNKIYLGNNVSMKNDNRIMITGNNCTIEIGDNTTFTHHCQLEAQEESTHIIIGNDCMFSNNVLVRTNDSHYIYDLVTGKRTNPPSNVCIGNHVWIAAHTTILKGVTIGDGAVVGYRSIVTKSIPASCVVVGTPAKIVQENVEWTREPKDVQL